MKQSMLGRNSVHFFCLCHGDKAKHKGTCIFPEMRPTLTVIHRLSNSQKNGVVGEELWWHWVKQLCVHVFPAVLSLLDL